MDESTNILLSTMFILITIFMIIVFAAVAVQSIYKILTKTDWTVPPPLCCAPSCECGAAAVVVPAFSLRRARLRLFAH